MPPINIIRHTLVALVRQDSDPPSYWRVRGGGGVSSSSGSGRAVRGGGGQNVLHFELSCDEFKSDLTEEDHTCIMTHLLNNCDPFD